jgi:group I intron endonuclease
MAETILSSSGIYKISNTANGKIYVGSAVHIGQRWRYHRSCLRRNKNRSIYLQAAWNKYGEPSFVFSVLEYVEDKSKLIEREQYWIDELRAAVKGIGYNISPTAGSTLGVKQTEETRRKVQAAKTGWRHSAEARVRMSIAQKGRIVTEEAKQKISEALTGRRYSTETREKIGKNHPLRGVKRSDEEIARRRATRIKNGFTKLTDEIVREIRILCQMPGSMSATARRFGVSVNTISLIVKRKSWSHVA